MNNIKLLPSLLIFAEIVKNQSFTHAAKQLGMSKSAVSQQIKRLEADIGQQLLSRHTRGMSITATGAKLLRRCELLRDQVNLAFEELNHSKEIPSGPFSLTFPHSLEKEIVIPAISQLCTEFPQIEPNIVVSDEPKDLIKNNLDVAIYGGELKDSNYRALPIGNVSEVFCTTPAYIHKWGCLTSTDDLLKHRIISTSWQVDFLTVFKNNESVKGDRINCNFFAKTNTLPSTLELVLRDMGVALLPKFYIQSEFLSGRLVRVLEEYQGHQWPFYMVHRFHGEKPLHIERFYQLVKHFFTKKIQ